MINVIKTELEGALLVDPVLHGDHRGYFAETYSKRDFEAAGICCDFVQDNESFTQRKGTLRGLHFQNEPMAQAKLVRVIRGALYDVCVDLRRGSPTYRRWLKVELSGSRHRMLYIPRGFAHGFVTLTDDVLFCYKVDSFYSPECDRSVRFDDPDIGVDWGVCDPILSDKDRQAPNFADSDCNFTYGKEI